MIGSDVYTKALSYITYIVLRNRLHSSADADIFQIVN